jgi:hypothetical protein
MSGNAPLPIRAVGLPAYSPQTDRSIPSANRTHPLKARR